MTTNPASTPDTSRRVVAEIVLSLDGRVNGAGGEYDMSWIVPHAISDTSRDRTAGFTQSSTTALVGRKNYEGFAGYWPSVADDEAADLRDRAFSRWFTSVQKVVFSTSITEGSLPNTAVTSNHPESSWITRRWRAPVKPEADGLAMSMRRRTAGRLAAAHRTPGR